MRPTVIVLAALLATSAAAAAPTKEPDQVELLREELRKVDRSIEETEKLIAVTRDAPYLPDLELRLAELLVEKSRFTFRLQAEQQPAKADRAMVSTETRLLKEKAISIYERLVREHPQHRHVDKALFYLAHEQRELGRFDEMIATLERLIRDRAKSPLRLEAELILGDHWFDKSELEKAEKHYRAILNSKPSPVSNLARYKLGWIYVNRGDHKTALKFFEAVAKSKPAHGTGRQGLDVRREALTDLVYSYSEVRPGKDALAYFRRLSDSPETYALALEKLALRYSIKQQPEFAIPALRKLLELSPDPVMDRERVERLDDALRLAKGKITPTAADVGFVVRAASNVRQDVRISPEERKKALDGLEEMARDFATQIHTRAKKIDKPAAYAHAAQAYETYLSLFRPRAHVKEMMHNHANALFAAQRYYEAAKQFEAVAKLEGEKEHEEVAYGALAAHVKALEPKEAQKLDAFARRDARQGVKLLGAAFVERYPNNVHVAEVELNVARAHYADGEYQKASELFAAFALKRPDHKDATVAGHLALDSLRRDKDFSKLDALGRKLLAANLDEGFKAEVREILAANQSESLSEIAIASSTAGVGVVDGLAKVAEENKGRAIGEKALHGAILAAREAREFEKERDLAAKFLAEYPKSSAAPEILLSLGSQSVEAARFAEAAGFYEQAAAFLGERPEAAESWIVAARLRLALHDHPATVKDLEAAARIEGPKRSEALALMAETFVKSGRRDDAVSAATRALAIDAGQASAAAIIAEHGTDEDALARARAALLAMVGGEGDDREAVARGLWHLAERDFRAYKAIPADQLDEKIAALQGMEALYSEAAAAGSAEWAIASLWKLGLSYQELVKHALESPPPAELSPQERAQFQEELQAQVAPLVQKTEELFATCLERSESLGVYSEAVAGCRQRTESPSVPPPPALAGKSESKPLQPASLAPDPKALESLALKQLEMGQAELAQLTLAKAVEQKEDSSSAHNTLGVASLVLGDATAAAAAYEKALQFGPRSDKARANLAALKCRYGDKEGARRELAQAKNLDTVTGTDVDPYWRSCR